jgi:hypothetical protein
MVRVALVVEKKHTFAQGNLRDSVTPENCAQSDQSETDLDG